MLEQLRKKRLSIQNQIVSRERINSVEKRKAIEANLQQFRKEKYSRPASPVKSAIQFYKPRPSFVENLQKMSSTQKQFNLPPPENIIQKIRNQPQVADKQDKEESIRQSLHFSQSGEDKSILQISAKQEPAHEIHIEEKPKQDDRLFEIKQEKPQQIEENEKVKLQIDTEFDEVQKAEKGTGSPKSPKKVKFDVQEFSGGIISPVNASSLPQNKQTTTFQPSYEKKEENPSGLHFNYNESHYASSSNNSSAIFFTSQFKQYINRENSPPKKLDQSDKKSDSQNLRDSKDEKMVSDSFLKIGQGDDDVSEQTQENQQRRKVKTQSGKSQLAFSISRNESKNDEDSVLKYSHANSSAVHDLVNKKLDEELVLQIGDFSRKKILEFLNKFLLLETTRIKYQIKTIKDDLIHYGKINKIVKSVLKISYRIGFDEILIYNQFIFEQTKNQIKIRHFLQDTKKKRLTAIIRQWKDVIDINEAKSLGFQVRKNAAIRKNIFKVFKMIWYDKKVAKQADLYYLSKVFTQWRKTAQKQKKRNDHIALKQYCRSLKRTFFYKIMEGVDNMRRQRQNKEAAEDFYRYTLLRKHFQGWANSSNREPQYISLAMTSKNTFKQTKNNKWLETRSINFIWKNTV